jgi:hypothetical protein
MSYSAEEAESLFLHREWSFYVKSNKSSWEKESFIHIYKIKTVKHMWQLLNNISYEFTGITNIFFMQGDTIPLWEEDKKLWSGGGCWSTVIKGTDWTHCMKEICLIVMGETVFDDSTVKGICIVPVAANHSIIKLWTTSKAEEIGIDLTKSLHECNCCNARFKSFT